MVEYWAEHGPPTYVGVAAYLGLIKKKKKGSSKPGDLNELTQLAGLGGMIH